MITIFGYALQQCDLAVEGYIYDWDSRVPPKELWRGGCAVACDPELNSEVALFCSAEREGDAYIATRVVAVLLR